MEEVEVGSFYEIKHTKLPRNSPVQLNPIRIAMVIEKNDHKVSLRFPSMSSLRTHFRHGSRSHDRTAKTKMMIPALDEKYVMGSIFAGEVLYRKIPSEEWSERRHSWSFWVVPSMAASTENALINTMDVVSKKETCLLSELKSTEMVKWGKSHKVKFISRHNSGEKISNLYNQSSSNTAIDGDDENIEADLKPNEEEEEGDEEEEEKIGSQQRRKNRKRKCKTQNRIQTARQNENQRSGYSPKRQKVLKNAINRWSEERFKLAEESMLKVMKEKGAVAGSPILRLELRQEARKWIGDTGLLDHLLKHMAGKVAPGGVERFRRRHNPEGAMEYWLEKADLVRIRREAGVQDSYWIPPPGWKPGDNPSQDPISAMEIKEIKEKMAQMEREMEELKSKYTEENQAIVTTPRSCVVNQNAEDGSSSWLAAKEMFLELVKRNVELEEQMMTLSHSLKDMEIEMVKLKSSSVNQAAVDQELGSEPGGTLAIAEQQPADTGKEDRKGIEKEFKFEHEEGHLQLAVAAIKDKAKVRSDKDEFAKGQQVKATSSTATQKTAAAEAKKAAEKAAMVQRLKSGFRICRPQGTFLWPDMASPSPSQSVVPIFHDTELLLVPPALSSTAAIIPFPLSPPLPRPPSPIKPKAQKRPIIKIKVPNMNTTTTGGGGNSTPTSYGHGSENSTLLDLNNAPSDNPHDTGIFGTSPTSYCSSYTHNGRN